MHGGEHFPEVEVGHHRGAFHAAHGADEATHLGGGLRPVGWPARVQRSPPHLAEGMSAGGQQHGLPHGVEAHVAGGLGEPNRRFRRRNRLGFGDRPGFGDRLGGRGGLRNVRRNVNVH